MTQNIRPYLTLLYDGVVAAVAFGMALLLRHDFGLSEEAVALAWYALPYGFMCMSIFSAFGLHRSVWRYTSTNDLFRLVQAVSLTILASGAIIFLMTRLENFPRTAFIILWLLHLALAIGPRAALRLFKDRMEHSMPSGSDTQQVLLIGAGNGADTFLREVNRQNPRTFHVHGLLDDDKGKVRRLMHGVPVLGEVISLPQVLDRLNEKGIKIDLLVLTEEDQATMETMLSVARTRDISVKRVPGFSALEEGETPTNLRPVLIEDLLGRDPVKLDMVAIDAMVRGKRVLVTGAGGSIGSELCRQIAQRHPAHLVLADNAEHALYQIDMEVNDSFPDLKKNPLLVDIKDVEGVNDLLTAFPVDIIFHAAAYKHVPMVETNPVAGVENNLFGTITVAEAAVQHKIGRVVIISTDKAVNPTNVMGATKRAGEIYCQNRPDTQGTRFTTVRFGNVLGSTGSVVPLFTRQIREGGPLTVTHKKATRYFMTIPEAVQLTLQAASMGKDNEVFMLDMGEPVSIYEMAEEMIRLSGLTPHVDIEIREIGLRPGEKLFEELWYNGEEMTPTGMEKICLVKPLEVTWEMLQQQLETLKKACHKKEYFQVVQALQGLVPGYTPAENSPFYIDEKVRRKIGEK